MLQFIQLCSFVPLLLWSFLVLPVAADFTIDDTNSSVTYTCNGEGTWETYGANNTVVDTSLAFNMTVHVNWKPSPCHIVIPFVGSGVTFYVLLPSIFNATANASVDGGEQTTYTLPSWSQNTACANNFPFCGQPNTTFFSIQGLNSGGLHKLTVNLNTPLFFDYALVSQTISQGSSKNDSGAVVGGVIGAVIVLVALVALFLWMRRNKSPKEITSTKSEPFSPEYDSSYVVTPFPASSPIPPFSYKNLLQQPLLQQPLVSQEVAAFDPPAYFAPNVDPRPSTEPSPSRASSELYPSRASSNLSPSRPTSNLSPPRPTSDLTPSRPTSFLSSIRQIPDTLPGRAPIPILPPLRFSTPSPAPSGPLPPLPPQQQEEKEEKKKEEEEPPVPQVIGELTPEQARYVYRLHEHNLPPSTIADIVNEILAGREPHVSGLAPAPSFKPKKKREMGKLLSLSPLSKKKS